MSIAINFVCKFNNVEFIIRDLCEAFAWVDNDCTVYPNTVHNSNREEEYCLRI